MAYSTQAATVAYAAQACRNQHQQQKQRAQSTQHTQHVHETHHVTNTNSVRSLHIGVPKLMLIPEALVFVNWRVDADACERCVCGVVKLLNRCRTGFDLSDGETGVSDVVSEVRQLSCQMVGCCNNTRQSGCQLGPR